MALNKAPLDEVNRAVEGGGFLHKIGGWQFIAAQFFTIAATVLGVYLAGYVGFQRTLEYDRYQKARQQADILQAIHAELKDNTSRIREFVEKRMDETGSKRTLGWPRLRLFVWRAVGQTQAPFDMPPEVLAGMQAFYEEANDLLTGTEVRSAYNNSSGSYVAERTAYKQQLVALLQTAESKLMSSVNKAVAEALQQVEKYSNASR